MRTFVLILFVVVAVNQCSASLLEGIIHGAVDVHNKVHNAAGAFLGGVAEAISKGHHHAPKPDKETIVVVVEEGPDRPPQGNPGYGGGRPPNQNGYGNNYNNRPYGGHQQQGYGQNYGNQNPNYNQNGNGNWNPNNQYGNPYNRPGKPGNRPQYPYGNSNNQQGNHYGNPNNQYGNTNNQYGNPNNHYGNPNNHYGIPNNQYGNQNNQPGNPPYQQGNQYGNPNYQQGNPTNPSWNTNNQHGNPDQGKPNYQEQTTEHAHNFPEKPNNDVTTNKPISGPNYGYNSPKPTDGGYNTNQQNYNNNQEKTTKKPTEADDYPLFVPLKDYVYNGDKIEVNAPKRETDNSKPKPTNEDADEDLQLDIRMDSE